MPNDADFNELERRVADLTQRIYRLEQQLATGHFLPGAAPPKTPYPIDTTAASSGTTSQSAPPPPPSTLPASIQPPLKAAAVTPKRDLESVIGSQWLNRIGILAMM